MQYLGVNPRSSPSDQYFHSKVLDANTTQNGGGGCQFKKFNREIKHNFRIDKTIVKTTLIS